MSDAILIQNGTGTSGPASRWAAPSGDVSMDATGAFTVTGFNGGSFTVPVTIPEGGTGVVTYAQGDMLYFSGSGSALSRLPGNATTTKKYLNGTGTGSLAGTPAWSVIAAADLPTTGLTITQHAGTIAADTDGATITFDLSASDWHKVTLGGNRTLALTGAVVGQQFSLILVQDGTGSRTVTWFSGIKWPGGAAPTLSTAAGAIDVITFKCVSSGVYYGFPAGLNLS